jgi:hypothetical protein
MSEIKIRELIILIVIRKVTMSLEYLNFGCFILCVLQLFLLLVFDFLGLQLKSLQVNNFHRGL